MELLPKDKIRTAIEFKLLLEQKVGDKQAF
jgi:hypothetical protein